MRQIYFSSTLLWQKDLKPIFTAAQEHAVGGIEFWAEQAEFFNYDTNSIREFLLKNDIHAVVHSKSWDLNLASIDTEIRLASIDAVKNSIDFAAKIGVHEVTVHPPHHTMKKEKDFSLRKTRESLSTVLEYAQQSDIALSLEIMEKLPREIITNDRELKAVLQDLYPKFHYTVDVAHCDCEKEIFSLLSNIDNVSKMHISNRRGKKLHTVLNDGDYSFKKLLPKLLAYKLPLVLEGMGSSMETSPLDEELRYINRIIEKVSHTDAAADGTSLLSCVNAGI